MRAARAARAHSRAPTLQRALRVLGGALDVKHGVGLRWGREGAVQAAREWSAPVLRPPLVQSKGPACVAEVGARGSRRGLSADSCANSCGAAAPGAEHGAGLPATGKVGASVGRSAQDRPAGLGAARGAGLRLTRALVPCGSAGRRPRAARTQGAAPPPRAPPPRHHAAAQRWRRRCGRRRRAGRTSSAARSSSSACSPLFTWSNSACVVVRSGENQSAGCWQRTRGPMDQAQAGDPGTQVAAPPGSAGAAGAPSPACHNHQSEVRKVPQSKKTRTRLRPARFSGSCRWMMSLRLKGSSAVG